jgi:hypothetical protein
MALEAQPGSAEMVLWLMAAAILVAIPTQLVNKPLQGNSLNGLVD